MKFEILIKYFNNGLLIGLEDVRNAWYFPTGLEPVKLNTVVYQGNLAYRFPAGGKRISYSQLKDGLVKKNIRVALPLELLPF